MNDDHPVRPLAGREEVEEDSGVSAHGEQVVGEFHYPSLRRLLAFTEEADANRRPGPAPTASEIITALTRETAPARSPKDAQSGVRRGAFGWRSAGWLAAAAVLATLIVGVSYVRNAGSVGSRVGFGAQHFVTGPDEQATVVLTDGTVVRLAPDSRLNVPDDASGREVGLIGRAYFAVAHDPSRPFRIRTGSGQVRVLGTRFTLDTSSEDLRLVVVEGRVKLETPDEPEVEVAANQMARVVRGLRLPIVEVPDPALMTDWVGNFLAFQNTPLGAAVAEIEREYGVDIAISDPDLTNRTITAWFAGWSLEDVMEVVCVVAGATCEVGPASVLMSSR
jgi:transmembrane sensor